MDKLKEIENTIDKINNNKKNNVLSDFNLGPILSENKAIIIIASIILALLLIFKPKMIRDEITNKVSTSELIKWWIILVIGAYFSHYIFLKFES